MQFCNFRERESKYLSTTDIITMFAVGHTSLNFDFFQKKYCVEF